MPFAVVSISTYPRYGENSLKGPMTASLASAAISIADNVTSTRYRPPGSASSTVFAVAWSTPLDHSWKTPEVSASRRYDPSAPASAVAMTREGISSSGIIGERIG